MNARILSSRKATPLFRRLSSLTLAAALLAGISNCFTGVAVAQELPKPTKFHEQLARDTGVWEGQVKMWPAPGMDPIESTGTETNKMLGAFWLTSQYEGDFQGMPFTGHGLMGYDKDKQEYVCTWVDTMAPNMFLTSGTYDVASQTLTLTGDCQDWMTGQPKHYKQVTTYIDPTHKKFEMFEAPNGSDQWHKSLEITYTKKQ